MFVTIYICKCGKIYEKETLLCPHCGKITIPKLVKKEVRDNGTDDKRFEEINN